MPDARAPRFVYPRRPLTVRLVERPNRYLARVQSANGGASFLAHVPNPGRMEELLLPGITEGYVVPAGGPRRKTRFDLVAVRYGRSIVSIDSRVANRLVAQALSLGLLPEFGSGPWRPEVPFDRCRLDFGQCENGTVTGLLEVKSSNLRVGELALFPDAPTERGTRHLRTLGRAARRGLAAGVLFVIQHDRARAFAPNAALDPPFARALAAAARRGVVVRARTTRVTPGDVRWGRELPVVLP
ncbi:MAG: DNA/RNA nuclease SfsA [Thermoplasmata archaeon]